MLCQDSTRGTLKMSVFYCMELVSSVSCFRKKKKERKGGEKGWERSLGAEVGGLLKQEKGVFAPAERAGKEVKEMQAGGICRREESAGGSRLCLGSSRLCS